jgi:uncharacterized C2H2 Zn-finger protein
MIKFETREAWLSAAAEALRPTFMIRAGALIPEVRVGVGSLGRNVVVAGVCFKPDAAEDGVAQVYINPILGDAVEVLACLSHELIHVAIWEDGHGAAFQKIFKAMGHSGSALGIGVTDEYGIELATLAEELGDYPHSKIKTEVVTTPTGKEKIRVVGAPKTQTTRMLKIECPECGMITRTSDKWLRKLQEKHGQGFAGPCPLCAEMTEVK